MDDTVSCTTILWPYRRRNRLPDAVVGKLDTLIALAYARALAWRKAVINGPDCFDVKFELSPPTESLTGH